VIRLPNQNLTIHEKLKLHELLSFKTICMTKSHTMQALVTDPKLKTLLQQDVQNSQPAIQDLKNLLSNSIA
jgi:similar to spore coat protein